MWVKVLAVCATGMMCLSCIFTFSKGAWGGLAVAVVIFAIFLDRRLIALMGVTGVGALLAIPSIANRIAYLFTADYLAASRRLVVSFAGPRVLSCCRRAIRCSASASAASAARLPCRTRSSRRPRFLYFYMDNYYLKTLVEMGYLGLAFFILLLFGLVLWSLRSIGRTGYTRATARACWRFVRRHVRRAGALLLREYLRGAVYDGVLLEHGGSGYVPRVLPETKNLIFKNLRERFSFRQLTRRGIRTALACSPLTGGSFFCTDLSGVI